MNKSWRTVLSFFKKFAWSGSAVILAVVLALGLLSQSASAALPLTTTTAVAFPTISKATNAANGTGTCTLATTAGVWTEAAAGDFVTGTTIILTLPAGWSWCFQGSATLTPSAAGTIFTNSPTTPTVALTSATVITLTGGAVAGTGVVGKVTWSGMTVRANTDSTATGSIALSGTGVTAAAAHGTVTSGGSTTAAFAFTQPSGANQLIIAPPGTTCDATAFTLYSAGQPQTVPADGSAAWVLCARLVDDVGNPAPGSNVTFSVSGGVVSTGIAKTTATTTNATGYATTTYRGQGNATTTDTAIVSFATKNAVATQTTNLVPASGGTASKVVIANPQNLAIAATITNTAPGYISSQVGSFVSLQVQDAAGLGVNSQVVLISVDRGALVAGQATTCVGGAVTAKSITATTASVAPTPGATAVAGTVAFTVCANQTDAPGKITITAQNVSTTMANATAAMSQAGRPAKVESTASGSAVTVKVTDAAGNPAADGTPIRFLMSTNAGAVSPACAPATNGTGTGVAALNQATGTVIITSDLNETGSNSATCNSSGAVVAATNVASAQAIGTGTLTIQSTVSLPSGSTTTTPPAGGTTGPGTAASNTIPRTGGLGFIVFNGGTLAQLVTASGCPSATAAFYFTVAGEFISYVPAAPTVVNAAVMANFVGGTVPAGTAALGKCV